MKRQGWSGSVRIMGLGLLGGAWISAAEPDVILGKFEDAALDGWKADGAAFHYMPAGDAERAAGALGGGFAGTSIKDPETQGTLTSPEFTVERRYLNFLIAGPRDLPGTMGAELWVGGEAVRAASATEAKDLAHTLYWRTWDLKDLKGRRATIRLNDHSPTGALQVDQFVLSDEAKAPPCNATRLGHESHRPQYHYTALSGWLNDANGLLYYKDQWHLFHQHRPVGGTGIVWGHAVSPDLVHWQRLPTAITPEPRDAAASGSGLVDWENASGLKHGTDPPILLFYTLMPPANTERRATQCLAYSNDGLRTLQPFAGNPLLRTPATRDRDPKVFFHAPTHSWIMALSLSRNNTDRAHATYGLFRSADLKSWELLQELGPGPWYWECPDMFHMAVDGNAAQTKWVFMKGSGDYIVGEFDGKLFTPEVGPIRVHWGGNFYGAQTFSNAPEKRRIQIAWMGTGKDGPNSYPGMPFNQQMTFPRELTLRRTPEGPRIFREPVAEIAKLRRSTRDLGARALAPGENALAGLAAGEWEIELEVEMRDAKKLSLKCRGAELGYDVKSQKFLCFSAKPTVPLQDGKLSLHVLLDRTSIEAFANHGADDLSAVCAPDLSDTTLSLTVEGGTAEVKHLVVHELRGIWGE